MGSAATSSPLPADESVRGILFTNVLVVGGALVSEGGLLLLMWPYWLQSVIIGHFSRRRILALRAFSTEGFTINDAAVEATPATARRTANFFLLHYGFFHVAYAVFLLAFTSTGGESGVVPVTIANTGQVVDFAVGTVGAWDALWMGALGVSFWWSHRASHLEHVAADLAGSPNIGKLMFMPYARILPMHITILAGAVVGGRMAVLLFGALKTLADVGMHKVEHRSLQHARRA